MTLNFIKKYVYAFFFIKDLQKTPYFTVVIYEDIYIEEKRCFIINDLAHLIRKYQLGNHQSFEKIYSLLENYLKFQKFKFNDEEIYDEVLCSLPEIILKINYEKIKCFTYEHLLFYLKKCIKNKFLSIKKRNTKQKEKVLFNSYILNIELNKSQISNLDPLISELSFLELVSKLKFREKYIIINFFKEDKSIATIAKDLCLSRQTVNEIKNKALQKIRKNNLKINLQNN